MIALLALSWAKEPSLEKLQKKSVFLPSEEVEDLVFDGERGLSTLDWKRAEDAFTEALAEDPYCGRCRLGVGQALLGQRRLDEAAEALERCAVLFPAEAEVALARAWVALEAGDTAAATPWLDKAGDGARVDAARLWGRIDADEREAVFEQATADGGVTSSPLDGCVESRLRFEAGDAISGFVLAALCSAEPAPYLQRAASHHVAANEYATDWLTELKHEAVDSDQNTRRRALDAQLDGDSDKARELLARLLVAYPADLDLHLQRVLVLQSQGEDALATQWAERIVAADWNRLYGLEGTPGVLNPAPADRLEAGVATARGWLEPVATDEVDPTP